MFRAGEFLLVAGNVLGWAGSVETAPERSLCVCVSVTVQWVVGLTVQEGS
jgi:hypothetical protein